MPDSPGHQDVIVDPYTIGRIHLIVIYANQIVTAKLRAIGQRLNHCQAVIAKRREAAFQMKNVVCGTRILRVTHGRDARATLSDIHEARSVTESCQQLRQLLRARFICPFRYADEEMIPSFADVAAVQRGGRVNGKR